MGQAGRFSLFIYCVEDERESALLHWRAPGSVTTLQIEMKAPRIPKPRKTNPLSRASVTDKENYLHKNVWCFWSPNFSGVQETGHSSVGLYLVWILLNLPASAVWKYQTHCRLRTRVTTGNRELQEKLVDHLRCLIAVIFSIAQGHS